jgi:hypothetical protein
VRTKNKVPIKEKNKMKWHHLRDRSHDASEEKKCSYETELLQTF